MSNNQPAAASGSMTSEHLDAYEEGTFSPTILGAGGNPTQTYTIQAGFYTKIGRVVYIHGRVQLGSSITPGSGAARLAALPFATLGTTDSYGVITVGFSNAWLTSNAGAPTGGYFEPGQVFGDLQVYDNDGGNVGATAGCYAADVDDGTDLIFAGYYSTA
jgi:hypothetical protein